MLTTPNARYGSLGPGPVDRDAERLAHEIFIARQRVFPERPQDVPGAVARQLRRLQRWTRALLHPHPRAHRPL